MLDAINGVGRDDGGSCTKEGIAHHRRQPPVLILLHPCAGTEVGQQHGTDQGEKDIAGHFHGLSDLFAPQHLSHFMERFLGAGAVFATGSIGIDVVRNGMCAAGRQQPVQAAAGIDTHSPCGHVNDEHGIGLGFTKTDVAPFSGLSEHIRAVVPVIGQKPRMPELFDRLHSRCHFFRFLRTEKSGLVIYDRLVHALRQTGSAGKHQHKA